MVCLRRQTAGAMVWLLMVFCFGLAAATGMESAVVDPEFPDLPLAELQLRSANLRLRSKHVAT